MNEDIPDIFKAYDIRGLVDTELSPDFAFAVGLAFAKFLEIKREPSTVIIGEDMRPSSPELAEAFSAGVTSNGTDVIRIGLASTDLLYFAAGSKNLPGAMFTASHNPAAYNGIKLCLSGARPIGKETGLQTIEKFVRQGMPVAMRPAGIETHEDLLQAYADHLHKLISFKGNRRLKIVIDAGNGMAGFTAPAIFDRLGAEIIPLYFELDGNFPNHEANPIDPANLRDLQKAVLAEKADIGLAFDGDADRCFLVDDNGETVDPSLLTALIASRELAKHPGATIIHSLISSRTVVEVINELGGIPVRSRVGHSYIKALMAETGAVFGGEHSGHFYFKDFWRADSGALAALHALAALGESDQTVSQLLAPFKRYVASGEVNSQVADSAEVLKAIREKYSALSEYEIDELDGLTVSAKDWWFNVRASNTEPLLRLNVEADTAAKMAAHRDALLALINA
jgi:phosphomannomutase